MIVDPNKATSLRVEHVLVEPGGISLHDGQLTPPEGLASGDSPFHQFCRSLDPNLCFISALVPDDAARPLFFKAREQAQAVGVHMQAGIEEPSRQHVIWEQYCAAKRHAVPEAGPDAASLTGAPPGADAGIGGDDDSSANPPAPPGTMVKGGKVIRGVVSPDDVGAGG